jgi:hypothetical protein
MKIEKLDERVRRVKARWLRRVMYQSGATSTQKCLAYAISDHLNCVTQDCWPAQSTLADLLGLRSVKSVQRAARGLVALGFIDIKARSEGDPGYRYVPTFVSADGDKSVPVPGQSCPGGPDTDVGESSLHIQTESSSTSSSGEGVGRGEAWRRPFDPRKRGAIELELAKLLGSNGMEILSQLSALDDDIVSRLCRAFSDGAVGRRELAAARLAAEHLPRLAGRHHGGSR